MAQPEDPIDRVLVDLYQDLSNTLTMLNTTLHLRENTTELLQPLGAALIELRERVGHHPAHAACRGG
jgi:hypothetical protein